MGGVTAAFFVDAKRRMSSERRTDGRTDGRAGGRTDGRTGERAGGLGWREGLTESGEPGFIQGVRPVVIISGCYSVGHS